ncbi:DUF1801 domain-containing protein [Mucilaginibacter sp. OK098]|uniref:DUF1801 domain-containing protein n=1 Tax=Mucilaginibacter sp. OK098 TaxID=1855297 RepID=UPI00092216F5|nr:DUF1801 domain-containing protein [Mucilaginibacter sp. OK098]SHN32815.1 protein of unknown function (DU1801) [Mucilaginibacter sp. OK098]
MTVTEYISSVPAERQATLTTLHEAILANDPTVTPVIKPMMGKEMILYEERCYMKYGLASTKNYMSLHCLPMYMNPSLHSKYADLLPAAKFQKGCINFTDGEALPPAVLTALIAECSSISIADMLEKRKKK